MGQEVSLEIIFRDFAQSPVNVENKVLSGVIEFGSLDFGEILFSEL